MGSVLTDNDKCDLKNRWWIGIENNTFQNEIESITK